MGDWAGFFFIGSGIVPGVIILDGYPGLAVMAFLFLLIAGGLCGIADPESPCRSPRKPRR
jgi:hypothetical protein